jgi:hypothetical protein
VRTVQVAERGTSSMVLPAPHTVPDGKVARAVAGAHVNASAATTTKQVTAQASSFR